MMTRAAMITGTTMDRKDTIAETVSSTKLTIGLATPPVVAVTAGRKSNDLAACTVPATTSPRIIAKMGLIVVTTLVLAANKIAPATGRTNV